MLSKGSRNVTFRDNLFTGHVTGIVAEQTLDALITRNNFRGGSSDGIQIFDSHRAILSENHCTEVVMFPGAHSDCIQLGSTVGQSVQSDIYLLNNVAIGDMQGFAGFTPAGASGTRITFAGNLAAVTFVHAIACFGCSDSMFVDDVLSSLPTSQWSAALSTPGGINNVFSNNAIFDLRGKPDAPLPQQIWSFLQPTVAGLVGSSLVSRSHNSRAAAPGDANGAAAEPVPEPATWLLMGLGFSLVGRSLRRRSGPMHVLA